MLSYIYSVQMEDPNKLDVYQYPVAEKGGRLPSREDDDYLMAVAEVINQNIRRKKVYHRK